MSYSKKLTAYKGFVVPEDYILNQMTDFEAFSVLQNLGLHEEATNFYFTHKSVVVPSGMQVTSPSGKTFGPGDTFPFYSKTYGSNWEGFQDYFNSGETDWQISDYTGATTDSSLDEKTQSFLSEANLQLQKTLQDEGVVGAKILISAYTKQLQDLNIDVDLKNELAASLSDLSNKLDAIEDEQVTRELSADYTLPEIHAMKEFLDQYGDKIGQISLRSIAARDTSQVDLIVTHKTLKQAKKLSQNANLTSVAMGLILAGNPEGAKLFADRLFEKGEGSKGTFPFESVFSMFEGKTLTVKEAVNLTKDVYNLAKEDDPVAAAIKIASRIKSEQLSGSQPEQTINEEIASLAQSVSELDKSISEAQTKDEKSMLTSIRNAQHAILVKKTFRDGSMFLRMFESKGIPYDFFEENFLIRDKKTFQMVDSKDVDWENFEGNYSFELKSKSVENMRKILKSFKALMYGQKGARELAIRNSLEKTGLAELIQGDLRSGLFNKVAERVSNKIPDHHKLDSKRVEKIVKESILDSLAEYDLSPLGDVTTVAKTVTENLLGSQALEISKSTSFEEHETFAAEQSTLLFAQYLASHHASYDHSITTEAVSIIEHFLGAEVAANAFNGVFENDQAQYLYFSIFPAVKNGNVPTLKTIIDQGITLEELRTLLDRDVVGSSESNANMCTRAIENGKFEPGSGFPPEKTGKRIVSSTVVAKMSHSEVSEAEKDSLSEAHTAILGSKNIQAMATAFGERDVEAYTSAAQSIQENIDNLSHVTSEQKEVLKKYIEKQLISMSEVFLQSPKGGDSGKFGYYHEWITNTAITVNELQKAQSQGKEVTNFRELDADQVFFDPSNPSRAGLDSFQGFSFNVGDSTHLIGKPKNDVNGGIDLVHFEYNSKTRTLTARPHEVKMEKTGNVSPSKNNMGRFSRTVAEAVQKFSGGSGEINVEMKGTLTSNVSQDGQITVDCTEHLRGKSTNISSHGIAEEGRLKQCQ